MGRDIGRQSVKLAESKLHISRWTIGAILQGSRCVNVFMKNKLILVSSNNALVSSSLSSELAVQILDSILTPTLSIIIDAFKRPKALVPQRSFSIFKLTCLSGSSTCKSSQIHF